jgi:uncharacterized membrane protein YfcA
MSNDFMKPLLLFILSLYSLFMPRKTGSTSKDISKQNKQLHAVMISVVVGFYDGFIGPGKGAFSSSIHRVDGFDFCTLPQMPKW